MSDDSAYYSYHYICPISLAICVITIFPINICTCVKYIPVYSLEVVVKAVCKNAALSMNEISQFQGCWLHPE